ncbi:MAG: AAA family ATPase [Synechococcus sp.]
MRLLSAHLRDYRLHRDLAVTFDPRFTVISGANQSGKSTLAEALHRALFLPVKTGGAVLEALRTDPFLADPEVLLAFECGGERWELRKRFAGSRGRVSLQDSRGRSLQGDEAEQRLAELIGTTAVPRTRAAGEQLKERWGHLWVWQGAASRNPLEQGAAAYDHDRLVERLQAGASLVVQSPLDLAVLDDIQCRWGEVFTAGGANRAPQVRRGSGLQLARVAVAEAEADLEAIDALLAEQEEARQRAEAATQALAAIAVDLPVRLQEQRLVAERLRRCQELQTRIEQERALLEPLGRELLQQQADRQQLETLQQRAAALEAAQAPRSLELEALRQQRQGQEEALQQARQGREQLQQATERARLASEACEQRLQRARLIQQGRELAARAKAVEELQERLDRLERDLAALPPLDGPALERLRALDQTLRRAEARAEALAAGLEVIRAGQPLRLDGPLLAAGGRVLLAEPATLQVGNDVELRLLPGGGTTAAEASQQRQAARQALEGELQRWRLASLEEAARAERRRAELLAERQRLLEQRGHDDPQVLQRRLQELRARFLALPPSSADDDGRGREPEEWLQQLEAEQQQARTALTQALAAEREQQGQLQQLERSLASLSTALDDREKALRQEQNQLLEARTRLDALLQRWQTPAALEASIAELRQRQDQSQSRHDQLAAERAALDPQGLEEQARRLEQAITALQGQEREAREARIRAESRLQGEGLRDLPAEREQKLAALESRRLEQERLEREAAMLTLLRRLLEEEQNAMASQYTAPLTERIGTYLAQVYPEAPSASLSYDAREGFQQLQWRRGDEAAFPFAVLSTGAREQFAAALRLSMAEILAEAYDGSLPLVFDDAFAYCDPERQAGVYRMLRQAADQGLQVILLTCDPERTQTIEAAQRVALP